MVRLLGATGGSDLGDTTSRWDIFKEVYSVSRCLSVLKVLSGEGRGFFLGITRAVFTFTSRVDGYRRAFFSVETGIL